MGGGPGFEAAALESVASFVGSTVDVIEIWVADNEPQWQSTCMAVSSTLAAIASKRPTRSSAACPTLKIHFALADVTKPLDPPENEAIAPLVASLDLVLFSYVLVETAAASRVGGWQLLRNLGQRLPFSSYVIALDAIHRVWPEARTALRQGAGRRGVAVWLPNGAPPPRRAKTDLPCKGKLQRLKSQLLCTSLSFYNLLNNERIVLVKTVVL